MPVQQRPSSAVLIVFAFALTFAATTAVATECGADAPCSVEGGEYYAAMPEGPASEARPALVFFHGWGSSGRNVVRNKGIAGAANARGYVVIAPHGLVPTGRRNRSWAHQGSPSSMRDESRFVRAVMVDAAQRLNIDPERVFVSGFSQGGSMAWHLACFDGDQFTAFAPIAGAFWRPHPETCPSPATRLLHVHGEGDGVVPLRGRPIGTKWYQGDVFEALESMREWQQCTHDGVQARPRAGTQCRRWDACDTGASYELCLHEGGHTLPKGWVDIALDWFEGDAG